MFTQYFLTHGIRATAEWEAAASKLGRLGREVERAYRRFAALPHPNEAATEQDLIRPVLGLLGWTDYLPQQGAAGNDDVPDHLLCSRTPPPRRAPPRGAIPTAATGTRW